MTNFTLNFTIDNYANLNYGMYAEQNLVYHFTGEVRKHDCVPFDKDSDLPEMNMSIKSNGFSLASGKSNRGNTLEEKLDDFFARVHSTQFAYVTLTHEVFIMNADEFRSFLNTFGTLTYESEKNGGYPKVRARKESKKMIEWLISHS